ncbi:MAG: hypothetical protein KDB06_10680 [Ilumatobacter sp.]|nr:hypothetical protein [Ilumatobacter sp.]MCB0985099.1 hypothetical protein [Ilumatobacter sp.]
MSLTDEQVIDRLRMALDEVATAAIPETTNVVTLRRTEHHRARWLAVAAATVLVAGGVVALATRGDGQPAPATTPTTPEPDTTGVPPTTQAPDKGSMPLAIVSPDFVGGEVVTVDRPGIGGFAMAWTRDTADGTDILILSTSPDAAEPYVTGYGLTDAEIADLTAQLAPGSGLPYVLPVDGWQLAGFGDHLAGSWQEQLYTPAVTDPTSSYIPTVQLTVGSYRGQLEALPEGQVTPVTINGDHGWRVDLADGTVVVWQLAGTGQWAELIVAPELSNQVEALLAAIV